MNVREIAHRVFAAELGGSSVETRGEDESAAAYVITGLGAALNRVYVAGTLTEKSMSGTEDDPTWRITVEDPTGRHYIQAGRFNPEAAAQIASIDADSRPVVGVVGKLRTWTSEEGKTYVNIRPERVSVIDEEAEKAWMLDAAKGMWSRLLDVKTALANPEAMPEELAKTCGMDPETAKNIVLALDSYGPPESSKYIKAAQAALRRLLPDRSVDFGMPEDVDSAPEPSRGDSQATAPDVDEKDVILSLIEELDVSTRGASIEELTSKAAVEGISAEKIEMYVDELMDEGQVYEPNLGFLRRV